MIWLFPLIILNFHFSLSSKLKSSSLNKLLSLTDKTTLNTNQLNFLRLIQTQMQNINTPSIEEQIFDFYTVYKNTKDKITSGYLSSFPFCGSELQNIATQCTLSKNTTESKLAYYDLLTQYYKEIRKELTSNINELESISGTNNKNNHNHHYEQEIFDINANHIHDNNGLKEIASKIYEVYNIEDTLNLMNKHKEIVKENDEDMLDRNAHGQMLFDKVSFVYKDIQKRHEKLIEEGKEIMEMFTNADAKAENEVNRVKGIVSEIKSLSESIKDELQREKNNKYSCEGMIELKGRCDEIKTVYDIAIKTLDTQSKHFDELNQILSE